MAHAKGDRYQRDDTHKRKKSQAARDSKKNGGTAFYYIYTLGRVCTVGCFSDISDF